MSKNAPISAHAQVYVGSNKSLHWNIWNTSETDYEDIGGWNFSFKVATTQDGAAFLTKIPAIEDALTGMVKVDLIPADTSAVEPDTYYYTLARTDATHDDPVADGKFVLKARVT